MGTALQSTPRRAARRTAPARAGFTLLELLIVIAIVGILASVLVPNLLQSRTSAQYRAAEGMMRNLSAEILACVVADPDAFPGNGGFPADVGPSTPPPGCPEVDWPTRDEVPFNSTLDWENWDLGGGDRWVGITFLGEFDVRTGHGTNSDLGPGLTRFDDGTNIAVAIALQAP